MHDIDTSRQCKLHTGEMALRAGTSRRHVELARRRLGRGNEFADGFYRQRRIYRQHVLRDRVESDWREIAKRVERQFFIKLRRNYLNRGSGAEQGVAVGCGMRCDFEADHAAGPRPIVDDHLLAEHFAEFYRQHARHCVIRGADALRHDHADRTVRIIGSRFSACRGLYSRSQQKQRDGRLQDDVYTPHTFFLPYKQRLNAAAKNVLLIYKVNAASRPEQEANNGTHQKVS